jgi:hypothetical protein
LQWGSGLPAGSLMVVVRWDLDWLIALKSPRDSMKSTESTKSIQSNKPIPAIQSTEWETVPGKPDLQVRLLMGGGRLEP